MKEATRYEKVSLTIHISALVCGVADNEGLASLNPLKTL
jgi:hypothetical protein